MKVRIFGHPSQMNVLTVRCVSQKCPANAIFSEDEVPKGQEIHRTERRTRRKMAKHLNHATHYPMPKNGMAYPTNYSILKDSLSNIRQLGEF